MGIFPNFHLNFPTKIISVLSTMTLVAAMGSGVATWSFAEGEMERAEARDELALLTSVSAQIDVDMQAKQHMLRMIAEEIQADDVSPTEQQRFLERHPVLREEFFSVRIFDLKGNATASLALDQRAVTDVSKRAYFRDTVASKKGVLSAPFHSNSKGTPVIAITEPLKTSKGQFIGVLTGVMDLRKLSSFARLEALRSGPGFLFITADDGTLLHHPDNRWLLKKGTGQMGALTAAATSSDEGWVDNLKYNGEDVVVAHKRLKNKHWSIAVAYPRDHAFSHLRDMRLRILEAAALIATLSALIGGLAVKRLTRALPELRKKVEAFFNSKVSGIDTSSELLHSLKSDRTDEVGLLSRTLYNLALRREQYEADLRRLATTDSLTGLQNRRSFNGRFERAIQHARRTKDHVGLALLDVDKFKAINDTYGHGTGDEVLVELSQRLVNAVRETDTVARLAGDEFVIIFEHLKAPNEAEAVASKIIAAMQEPFVMSTVTLNVTISLGLAISAGAATTTREMLHSADTALYRVKHKGRNGFEVMLATDSVETSNT